jgi:hypothetical protein
MPPAFAGKMCMGFELSQRAEHSMKMMIGLRQLLAMRQELNHGEIPNAKRGLEGILEANRILEKKGAVGVLIGGLAEEIWKHPSDLEKLKSHKDVDVAVLTSSPGIEPFEGGIDWWLPQNFSLEEKTPTKTWKWDTWALVNGHHLPLLFQIKLKRNGVDSMVQPFAPGLYFMTVPQILQMRTLEIRVKTVLRGESLEIKEEALTAFEEKIAASMGPIPNSDLFEHLDARERLTGSSMGYSSNAQWQVDFNHHEAGTYRLIEKALNSPP